MNPIEECRRDYLNVEEHLKTIDSRLELLQEVLTTHIKDESDLTPIVKELVDAWKAAGFLVNFIKWIGIIAGAITAAIALLKGHKP